MVRAGMRPDMISVSEFKFWFGSEVFPQGFLAFAAEKFLFFS
jgi:hypothetical protein